jgi:3',5'-cyclic AMP phosphodiesterase CpdA
MKRPLAALLCLVLLLCACGTSDAASTPAPMPEAEGLRIAVASDLHFDPDNTNKKADLGAVAYNPELIDALLFDAAEQGAGLLLLTGDLVNLGRREHHEALAEKLRAAEAGGMSIFVLPGNHDLAPVSQREFAEIYADFGYDEAYSRDRASLSFCVMRSDLCLLMMDTAGYDASAIDLPDAPHRTNDEAFLSETTLRWVEQMLAEAQQRNLPVLCAGHFNILTSEGRDPSRSGLYLENGDRFAALLHAYSVPLYLSGHVHTRYALQEAGLTELITEYLLAYPTGYSMLDLTPDAITYTPRRVNVDAWAAATGQKDRTLLHFTRWQQKQLRRYSVQNVNDMCVRNPLTHREAKRASAFFYAAMDAYWRGTLAEERETILNMRGCEPFFRCAKGYAYEWWLRDLIENASPQLGGFTIPIQKGE